MKYKCILLGLLISSAAISAESKHPALERPELTTKDLASILGLSTVKGRLPNAEGWRISSYQVIFRSSNGTEKPLSDIVEYNYDEYKMDDIGHLIVSLATNDGAYELYLKAENYAGSTIRRIPVKKKDYVMVCSQEFKGDMGVTVNDLSYVVPVGDSVVFSFYEGVVDKNSVPDTIIIRTIKKG